MFRSKKSSTVPIRTKEKSSLLAPCINCEEFIPFDKIDYHAQFCNQVSNKVLKYAETNLFFEENDFKLSKLKANLQNKPYQHMQRLCRICELVSQINTIGCVEEASLKEFEKELLSLSQEPSQSINQSLYIERIHSLVMQRMSIIQNQLNLKVFKPTQSQQQFYPQQNINIISNNFKNTTDSPLSTSNNNLKNLIQNKLESSPQVFNRLNKLDYCQSPDPRMTYITKFSQNSPVSQFGQTQQHQKSEILTHISEQYAESIDEYSNPKSFAQRCFYSKVLNLKLHYPQSNPAQKIPVSILWRQVEKNKIKPQDWEQFIRNCLDKPFQILDPQKLQ
ncbi:unnamed protein product (macronuclear) [Paramecium tetraurelia]|uniref:Uncharacterized protein n=1 Tax=Paramecium tetraurelia TaxID=5888 RepID=A0DST5_PARTE|nr:uncharacterized protein GSPATT00019795001 [Paramecium tetraurelia]CAK86102.1 unnamed protein product [Paramecium tetraurelia]|eukprot:XP_001453499.1 hypothetical protein (macronuclear) [Paramecium tetraurelia strain d4-2]